MVCSYRVEGSDGCIVVVFGGKTCMASMICLHFYTHEIPLSCVVRGAWCAPNSVLRPYTGSAASLSYRHHAPINVFQPICTLPVVWWHRFPKLVCCATHLAGRRAHSGPVCPSLNCQGTSRSTWNCGLPRCPRGGEGEALLMSEREWHPSLAIALALALTLAQLPTPHLFFPYYFPTPLASPREATSSCWSNVSSSFLPLSLQD